MSDLRSRILHLARPGSLRSRLRRRTAARMHFALSDCLPLMKCACRGCRVFRGVWLGDEEPRRGWRACFAAWRLAGLSDPELKQLQRRVDKRRAANNLEVRSGL